MRKFWKVLIGTILGTVILTGCIASGKYPCPQRFIQQKYCEVKVTTSTLDSRSSSEFRVIPADFKLAQLDLYSKVKFYKLSNVTFNNDTKSITKIDEVVIEPGRYFLVKNDNSKEGSFYFKRSDNQNINYTITFFKPSEQ